jgi:tryptophan halogenase
VSAPTAPTLAPEFNRVTQVTIVGGGTAGWLTAMILNSSLNDHSDGPRVGITLIESPNVPTVGVGESTVPGMPRLLMQLGIDEKQFMRHCNASFKLGVRFVHWHEDDAGRPLEYFNLFNSPVHIHGINPAYHFHRFAGPEAYPEFAEALVPTCDLIRARRGPRQMPGQEHGQDYANQVGYAYHVDAALFALFLRDICVARGVEHVLDDVVEVQQGESGHITALKLKERGLVPVQLVVDCTGFRSRIIGQVLEEPFEPYSDVLLCDSALALQIPHPVPGEIEPCTRSTALGAGWSWRVPLHSRVGTGYVFSSRFRSDQEAIDEFLGFLGPQAPEGSDPKVIRMRIGRMRRHWVKNCVAIGLSSGFIEPLEATAIYTIETAARWLVRHFPDRAMSPVLADSYNKLTNTLYEEIRDFIVLHYHSTNRKEPFWLAARQEIELPARLAERLELWRATLPNTLDTTGDRLFDYWNYLNVLYCKGAFRDCSFALEGSIARRDWEALMRRQATLKQRMVAGLPDHVALLDAIRAAADQAENRHTVPPAIAALAAASRSTVPLPDWGGEAQAA